MKQTHSTTHNFDCSSLLNMDLNQIAKNIYLGDMKCAKNYKYLKELGVKHIVVAGDQLTTHFPDKFNYLHIKVRDSPKQTISKHFDEVCEFIQNAIKNKEAVFVHCAYGVSRSATLVIAFLMKKLRIQYLEALSYVRKKRPVIQPNHGFEEQLRVWQEGMEKVKTFQ